MSTWIEVDLEGLRHNYNHLKALTSKEVFAVVKDNAYGHGIIAVARELERNGVSLLCVFSVDEAVALRNSGINSDILVFAFTPKKRVLELLEYNFIYTVPSFQWFQEIEKIPSSIRLHIEINTGMNRIGLKHADEVNLILKSHHQIEGIYTHFGNPTNLEIGLSQKEKFEGLLSLLDYDFKWIHFGNAPISLIRDTACVNASRFGLGLYGYREGIEGLKPILSFYSELEFIDEALPGDTIGYDYTYEVKEALRYGTIPVGYSDGFDMRNALSNLFVDGVEAEVLGKICMNQTMLRIDRGSIVELIGENRNIHKIYAETGIMPYVLLTCLHEKIKRIYKKCIS